MNLREKAVGALVESIFQHNPALRSVNLTTTGEWSEHDLIPKQADAVIAAIEPDIRADERRKVFEELIADAEGLDVARINHAGEYQWVSGQQPLGTWLRSRSLTPHQRDYVRLCLAEERKEAAGEA